MWRGEFRWIPAGNFFEPLWTNFQPAGETGILDWYTIFDWSCGAGCTGAAWGGVVDLAHTLTNCNFARIACRRRDVVVAGTGLDHRCYLYEFSVVAAGIAKFSCTSVWIYFSVFGDCGVARGEIILAGRAGGACFWGFGSLHRWDVDQRYFHPLSECVAGYYGVGEQPYCGECQGCGLRVKNWADLVGHWDGFGGFLHDLHVLAVCGEDSD